MKFIFPPSFADLLENRNMSIESYQASRRNPLQGMDERMKTHKLKEFAEAFNIDPHIILDSDRFNFLYHLTAELRNKFDAHHHSVLLDTLQNHLHFLVQKMEHEFNEFDSTYQMTLFLTLNLLPLAPKKSPQPMQQQPQLNKGVFMTQAIKKSLKVVLFILTNMYNTLQRESAHYFFDLVQIFGDQREGEIRALTTNIVLQIVNRWTDLQHLKTQLINLVYDSEQSVPAICYLFQKCYQSTEEGFSRQFMNDTIQLMVQYITTQPQNSVENQAIKNLKEVLSQTSKLAPKVHSSLHFKYFYVNLANFMHLYECENYHMRNALTDILMHLVEYLVVYQDEAANHDSQAAIHARNKLIDTLLYRQHDKTAFARTSVLNAFSYLLKKNCVPKESLEPLFDMTLGRIKDTSGWVRKASIQTIKQIIKHFRHLYVTSQDQEQFYSTEAIQKQLVHNEAELDKIQHVFLEVKREFDCKLEEAGNMQQNMAYIKKETDRILQTKAYLEEYGAILLKISHIMNPIAILMGSRQQGDVIPSIKLAAYMARYKLEGYQRGLKKILLLIWSKDKGTKQEILKQFWKLYLDKKKQQTMMNKCRFNPAAMADNLLTLYLGADIQEETSLNEILAHYFSEEVEYKLPAQLFNHFWTQLVASYKRRQPNYDTVRALTKIVRVFFTQKASLCTEDHVSFFIDFLNSQKIESEPKALPEWSTIREVCRVFHTTDEKATFRCVTIGLLLLYQFFGCGDNRWFQVCEEVLNLAALVSQPERLYEFFVKRLCSKLLQLPTYPKEEGMSEESEAMQVEYEPSAVNQYMKYSQLVFAVGHIALKLLTHVDVLVYHLKQIKQSKKEETELDKIQGGQEAEYYKQVEVLQEITEKRILQQNMVSAFVPFIMAVVRNLHRSKRRVAADQQNSVLEKTCILTLCKFMCVSQDFCSSNIEVLFYLLKSDAVDQALKNNIIISLGDLLHRFPNVVQQYHKQIYSNLYDKNPSVRKITLLVLTHLILNDMIKSKISMKHVPRLLCDTDPKIPPMARYFLQELQKKDPRGILNCIPDLMSNLADNHESIVPQIVTYLDKNQADPLLDKLLVIMAETDDQLELRSIALCISLLPLQIVSFQRILDRWEEIRQKFSDGYVQEQMRNLLKKNMNPDLKNLLDELEQKLDNFGVETFESKRRVLDKSRRKARPQEPNMQMELEVNRKVNTPRIKQKKISKPKRRLQPMQQESDDDVSVQVQHQQLRPKRSSAAPAHQIIESSEDD